ncbi:MAG: RNA polymerase factor sigma-54 [Candidatus Eiseniibacteriota bacterium]|nr:MAG: RNA polymerase factor sigma-54 [Candidatus Eisenbacteria bacterium]
MELKHTLQLTQKPTLIMTQRLQQALKLLQVPTLELQQILKQELLQNPLLEEIDDIEESQETSSSEEEQQDMEEPEPVDNEDQLEWAEYYQEGYEPSPGRPDTSAEFPDKVPVTVSTLEEHLLSQLRLSTDDPELVEIGEFLIGSIEEKGFLTISVEEVAAILGKPVERVEEALKLIQTFDPPGIGARDLRECLLIQLEQNDMADSLAARIVRDHFDSLKERKFAEIAKKARVPVTQVQAAGDIISKLNPRPGHVISHEEPKYVVPDLIVEKVEDKYVVFLNDRHVPRLRIHPSYRDMLREQKAKKDKTREYIIGKLNSAKWLIQTIEQRRKTMVKVMKCIVECQMEFFDRGIAFLRPLTLQQVANQIGMHESTVSRVTNNKYVQTPRGVFELKFFFSSKLQTDDGEEMSAKSAKEIIAQLIDEEDKADPLSDQRIADILKDRGLKIARRTVAKYREQLRLLPARYRKRH